MGEISTRFHDRFDLVWCGSLLTHLPAERWRGFLELFRSLLRPHGLLVFTTHGRLPAAWMGQGLVHSVSTLDTLAAIAAGRLPLPAPGRRG